MATNTEPINDGDTDANTNRTLDFGVYLVPCNAVINLVTADAEICSNASTVNLTVQTNNTEASGLTFVYFNAPTMNPYAGVQTGTLGTATGNGTTAILNNATLPTTIATYCMYALLTNVPASPTCRPFAGTSVNVIDCAACLNSLTVRDTTICNGSTVSLFGQARGLGTLTYSTDGVVYTALSNPTNVTPSVSLDK